MLYIETTSDTALNITEDIVHLQIAKNAINSSEKFRFGLDKIVKFVIQIIIRRVSDKIEEN